jgi:predicted ATPase
VVRRLAYHSHEKLRAGRALGEARTEKNQFTQLAAMSPSVLGHVLANIGRATEAVALVRQSIARSLEIGSPMSSSLLVSLATAQDRSGAIPDALETIEQALQANPHELAYRPEALMIRGELRLKLGKTEEGEVGLREAIDLARTMGAKSWELRATLDLVRLLIRQGRREEARSILGEIYGSFTEGFDTADLQEAKALLDQLSALDR